ncbi:hypothetical protein [Streptomyces sp. NPDC015130]|uniref:hypothetical protein n=1 Tax=Streptomyces sp. NPDC015130 TaxID=3364940 RepID=UPI0036FB60F3
MDSTKIVLFPREAAALGPIGIIIAFLEDLLGLILSEEDLIRERTITSTEAHWRGSRPREPTTGTSGITPSSTAVSLAFVNGMPTRSSTVFRKRG